MVENNEFVISIEDDGRGINWSAIQEIATKAELPHENQEDLFMAIFHDGITTKQTATQFSGRGVGMGAVREECTKRGGKIELDSQIGKGTKFFFRFPMNNTIYTPDHDSIANAA